MGHWSLGFKKPWFSEISPNLKAKHVKPTSWLLLSCWVQGELNITPIQGDPWVGEFSENSILHQYREIPGLGRSPGGGHGNPLKFSCLDNPMDRRAWLAMVHRVKTSQTQLKWLSMQAHSFSTKSRSLTPGSFWDLLPSFSASPLASNTSAFTSPLQFPLPNPNKASGWIRKSRC